jgi:hypothetical protein
MRVLSGDSLATRLFGMIATIVALSADHSFRRLKIPCLTAGSCR